jgi:hypothetical protein
MVNRGRWEDIFVARKHAISRKIRGEGIEEARCNWKAWLSTPVPTK